MKKNILITGGAGFIGSSLIKVIDLLQYKIIAIDNFDEFYSYTIKEKNISEFSNLIKFYKGDITDIDFLRSIFLKYKIDIVIHLAAKAGVRPSLIDSKGFLHANVLGTLQILEVMREFGSKKIIIASSSSVYGNNIKIPYSESDNVDNPISIYAATKKTCELISYTFHELYKFDVLNLRFFTVYGPSQRPDLAIHKFFKLIYNNEPIDFYGNGDTKRDYTYIDDIVNGIINSINYLENHSSIYEILNLGNTNPVSLKELTQKIEIITGRKFIYNYMPMQMGDVNLTYSDISKARKLINYNPVTTIDAGLNKFNEWYKKNNL
jgi:UDP-glucuronate 4-epimerase